LIDDHFKRPFLQLQSWTAGLLLMRRKRLAETRSTVEQVGSGVAPTEDDDSQNIIPVRAQIDF
jgi:hypothetical protein